jgi:hypothetical protein
MIQACEAIDIDPFAEGSHPQNLALTLIVSPDSRPPTENSEEPKIS